MHGDRLIAVALDAYRYVSWLLTSAAYVVFVQLPGRWLQAGVVLSLLLAAIAAQYTYRMYWGNGRMVARIVLLETAALLALLAPTGGLDSVFVWYALNPMLVAAVILPAWWSPGVVTAFLAAAALLAPARAGPWPERMQTVLIFLLVTVAAQILAMLNRMTHRHNIELQERGDRLRRALDVQAALYSLIRQLATAQHRAEIAQVAAAAGRPLLGVPTLAVWIDGAAPAWAGARLSDADERWLVALAARGAKGPAVETIVPPPGVAMHPLTAGDATIGAIFLFAPELTATGPLRQGAVHGMEESLRGLSDMIAFAVERIGLEHMRQRLAIAAEKQRIAGELHDSVAQKLFSVSSALYALEQRSASRDGAAADQARLIGETARQAAEELRQSIHGLTSGDAGTVPLQAAVKRYLATLQLMHEVDVTYDVSGDDRGLNPELQRALLRILQEACGNALRHGRCTHLNVSMRIEDDRCELRIADNGHGFVPGPVPVREREPGRGLGLANMSRLASRFGGEFDLVSAPQRGTIVTVTVPTTRFPAVPAWKEANIL